MENKTAFVICSTPGLTAYYDNWKKNLKLSNDNYVLCDVSSDRTLPTNITLDFIQDNIINFTGDGIKSTLNFDVEPSDKHWWNHGGGRNAIWFYAHLRMLYFYKIHPEYEYYWFFDDDVTFPNFQLDQFLESHNPLTYDCMITYLFSNLGNENPSNVPVMDENMGSFHAKEFNWLTHYPGHGDNQPPYIKETYGSFFPIVRYSNRAMKKLLEEHENGYYGYSEGYVPTVLNHHGMSLYSIYNKNSKVELNNDILIHHKNWEMYWKSA